MNKNKVAGNFKVALGTLEEKFAVLSGSHLLRQTALERQAAGRVQHTIGEAQDLIKRSLRQRSISA
ncbi:CsbD family protein [Herbaspirillum lusitanum]|jgi:uncharacterized protein YjbJ (UPF0337 family)|uniref:CsbD family protein n=1 Tax=Herbaspirillum lusitanum TaxID=213312 RepID=A0ABW9A461_9BURK